MIGDFEEDVGRDVIHRHIVVVTDTDTERGESKVQLGVRAE